MPYANFENEKAYHAHYRATHREELKEKGRQYYGRYKDRTKVYWQTHATKRKHEVMVHYSGTDPPQCKDPYHIHEKSFTLIDALTIEHPNQDGAEERRRLFGKRYRAGQAFYRWLVNHNYPEGYEVLCFNCQWIRRAKVMRGEPL